MEDQSIAVNRSLEIKETILATFGYLLVALICLSAGILFNSEKNFFNFSNFTILLPLFFFFLFWVYLYDYRKRINKSFDWYTIGIYIIFFILVVAFGSLLIKNPQHKAVFISSCIPFGILFFTLIFTIYKKKELPFRTFIFFPAVLSCVIPFMNGFVRDTQITSFIYLCIFFTVVLLLFFHKKTYHLTSYFITLAYLYFTGISFYFYDSYLIWNSIVLNDHDLEFIRAVLVAVNMAMVMGLTESWIFLKDPKNSDFEAESKNISFYELWVKNATSIFPFIIPFLFLHKSFNLFSFVMIFFSLYLYRFYERKFNIINDFKYWRIRRFFFGLLIPIFFTLGTLNWGVLLPDKFFNLTTLNFIVFSLVGISMGVLTILRNSTEQSSITEIFTPNKLIAITICMLFCIISWGFEYYAQPQKLGITRDSFNALPNKIHLDSLEKDKKRSLNQFFSIYKIDSLTNTAVKESYLILDLNEKNNSELQKRAGITKLFYALLFVWLILSQPVKVVIQKISSEHKPNFNQPL